MADLVALKAELDTDPLGRGYAGMTDQQAADSLNTQDRDIQRSSMTGDEIFQQTSQAEYSALDTGSGNTSDVQGHWLAFCGRDSIDPFAASNVAFVQDIFGAGSATVANLQAARTISNGQSRAEELRLGRVRVGEIGAARAM